MVDDTEQLAGVREGEILAGKYRVEKILGVGGMGVVVAARHIELDHRVALKFLLPALLSNTEAVTRFAREARAAVKIQSEHVARVLDIGTLENGAPYMVMEFLEGSDLSAVLLKRGPLPIELAVEFVLQACVAVADAHSLGIVHRDLKPANLFCVRRNDRQEFIKVLDFGISKMTDAGTGSSPPGNSMTKTSVVMGSPNYMSPEQVQSSKDVDPRSDIWSLGVILYELLSTKLPFQGESFGEMAVKISTEQPQSLRGYRPEIPAGLEAVIMCCLAKSRRRRYPTVAELSAELVQFAPARARVSAERITGILRNSAPPTDVSVVTPTQAAQPTAAGTDAPWSETRPPKKPARTATIAMSVVGLAAAALVVGVVAGRQTSPSAHAAATVSEPASAGRIAPTAAPEPATHPIVTISPEPASEPVEPAKAELVKESPKEEHAAVPVAPIHPSVQSTPTVAPGTTKRLIPTSPVLPPTPPATQAPAVIVPPPVQPAPAAPTVTAEPVVEAPKPNCTPPYTRDDQGRKVFKPECFTSPK